MSFLDEQATAQIGIGEKATLGTLTRIARKLKKGQNPTGAETYSLMPQNEFSNIVSSPTDIAQVGIGNLLTAQGATPDEVNNVFGKYTSAAPIGTTVEALYPKPVDDGDDDDDDMEVGTDPIKVPDISPSTNIYDPSTQTGKDFAAQEEAMNLGRYTDSIFSQGDKSGAKESMPIAQFLEAVKLDLQNTIPGGSKGQAMRDSKFNFGFSGDINTAPTAAQINAAEFGPQGGGYGTPGAPGYTPPTAQGGGGPSYSGPPSLSSPGGTGSGGGDAAAPGSTPDDGYGIFASGGVITKSKAKNKNSFMSMKGK